MCTEFSGNFGTVFADQSYNWQSSVAAKPKQGVYGCLAGGLVCFAVPFTFATTMGLAYITLSSHKGKPLLSENDVSSGMHKLFPYPFLYGFVCISIFVRIITSRCCTYCWFWSVTNCSIRWRFTINLRGASAPKKMVHDQTVMISGSGLCSGSCWKSFILKPAHEKSNRRHVSFFCQKCASLSVESAHFVENWSFCTRICVLQ